MVSVLRKITRFVSEKTGWTETSGGMRNRRYASYEQYVEHQKSKLGVIKKIEKKSQRLHDALRERLPLIEAVKPGRSVLCLGARSGAECAAFCEMGLYAIGVDLNPGPENRYVVYGDFHALQFSDNSVDLVYTNSLDHSFDLAKVISEVRRVVKPGGTFIAEIMLGDKDTDGRPPGDFEALWWSGPKTWCLRSARSIFPCSRLRGLKRLGKVFRLCSRSRPRRLER